MQSKNIQNDLETEEKYLINQKNAKIKRQKEELAKVALNYWATGAISHKWPLDQMALFLAEYLQGRDPFEHKAVNGLSDIELLIIWSVAKVGGIAEADRILYGRVKHNNHSDNNNKNSKGINISIMKLSEMVGISKDVLMKNNCVMDGFTSIEKYNLNTSMSNQETSLKEQGLDHFRTLLIPNGIQDTSNMIFGLVLEFIDTHDVKLLKSNSGVRTNKDIINYYLKDKIIKKMQSTVIDYDSNSFYS
ncbi:MAG: hypothetical protein QNK36_20230 [Colwellia sp.]|nr:hypothetical protein [Colwellia sp.]